MKFLPKNIFPPGASIPRAFVPEFTKEYDIIDVGVGEIFDLSKFWLFLKNGVLDEMMNNLQ